MDSFEEVLVELMDEVAESYNKGDPMTVSEFQQYLLDAGLWVVPVDDPTNFFGITEDSL